MATKVATPIAFRGAGAATLMIKEGCRPPPVRREEQARALGVAVSRKDRVDASGELRAIAEMSGPWEGHGRRTRVALTMWQDAARPISCNRLPLVDDFKVVRVGSAGESAGHRPPLRVRDEERGSLFCKKAPIQGSFHALTFFV